MKRFTPLSVVSLLLGIAALVLILISIFGNFERNWVLMAGLICVAIGNIINFIVLRKKNKKN